ncbi:SGNH/GDSL hydrolase family protein [Belliella pelovolcani]|uniref:SGNH/GDSL hydrolase family protein n=1 Tax=Belliella pelovolcani TaxID=529505 RepID=UPI0039190835
MITSITRLLLFFFIMLLINNSALGQTDWYDPLRVDFSVIEGRFVDKNDYFRLPSELQHSWKEGVNGIHHLSSEAIGLDQYDFVDGTHPTDGGMVKYAKAYMNKILEINQEERK